MSSPPAELDPMSPLYSSQLPFRSSRVWTEEYGRLIKENLKSSGKSTLQLIVLAALPQKTISPAFGPLMDGGTWPG